MFKKSESGRNVVEMIAIIVLIALLIALGLWGFRKASLSAKMNTMSKDISTSITERRYQIAQGGTGKEHSVTSTVGSTKMTVKNIKDAGEFVIVLSDKQSKDACEEIKKYDIFVPKKIVVNGIENGDCTEVNAMELYFDGFGNGNGGGGNGGGNDPLKGTCDCGPCEKCVDKQCVVDEEKNGTSCDSSHPCHKCDAGTCQPKGGKECGTNCCTGECDSVHPTECASPLVCPSTLLTYNDDCSAYTDPSYTNQCCLSSLEPKDNKCKCPTGKVWKSSTQECVECIDNSNCATSTHPCKICDTDTNTCKTGSGWECGTQCCSNGCDPDKPNQCRPGATCSCLVGSDCKEDHSVSNEDICSADACCHTGSTCINDSLDGTRRCCPIGKISKNGACVDEAPTTCPDGLIANYSACLGEKSGCCESGNCANGLCCPSGQVNVNGVCCDAGISEGGICSSATQCCLTGKSDCQSNGLCCKTIAENNQTCSADGCCKSGNCAGNTGNKHCCPTGYNYYVKECCTNDGTKGSVCSSNNCCLDGLTCTEGTCQETITASLCTPCATEGQICTNNDCNNLTEWSCDLENNRCCPAGKKWQGGKCVSTSNCPEGLKELGEACSSSECCASGNCAKLDGETKGLCCNSIQTLIKNGGGYSCGQDCSQDFGKSCSSDNQCCGTQTCQRRFGKRTRKSVSYQSCECASWGSYSCDTCGGKSTCYYCKKEKNCETKQTTQLVDNGEMADKTTCCTGDGGLGSPCSADCPCQGTAYIVDGSTEIVTNYKEVYYTGCGCNRVAVPLLYCRYMGSSGKGECVMNSYTYKGKIDTTPDEVNCANNYDFFKKDGLGKPMNCYRCPEGLILLEDSSNIACCTNTTTKYSSETCSNQYSKQLYDTDHTDGYKDGYYKEGSTWTACPKGYYCEEGVKYPCPAGTYNDITAQTTCKNCTAGNYCPEGATAVVKCPLGAICPNVGMGEPQWCAAGTYMSSTGSKKTSCTTCNKGYYCPGKTTQINCKTGGPEAETGEDAGDSKGYSKGYCPEKGMTAPKKGNTTNGSAEYIKTSSTVEICPKGYVCDGIDKVEAPLGTYADVTGLSTGKTVNPGYCGADAKDKCVTKGAVKQVACPAGTKGVNGECVKCEVNTYQNLTGQSSCNACGSGESSDAGATKCTNCNSGQVAQKSATDSQCCQTGYVAVKNESNGYQYCCKEGQRYCKKSSWGCYDPSACTNEVSNCAENQYMKQGICTTCPSDSFCNGISAEKCALGEKGENGVCVPCSAGTYGSSVGVCKTCANNKISESGQTKCTDCPSGTMSNDDHTACVSSSACEYGYTIPSGSKQCKKICKTGQYYDDGECKTCEMDHYCADAITMQACAADEHAATGATKCLKCTSSQFWNPNTGKCISKSDCPEGYQCQNGLVSSCPVGTTSAAGKTECNSGCNANEYTGSGNKCVQCALGEGSNGGDATSCWKCAGGTYGLGRGLGCKSCGDNMYTEQTGSTSVSKCKTCNGKVFNDGLDCCANGKLITKKDGKETCSSCPNNNDHCENWNTVICKAGYYFDESSTTCKSCGTNKSSKVGSTSADDCFFACTAKQYRSGETCKSCPGNADCDGTETFTCKANHYKDGSRCISCPGDRTSPKGTTDINGCVLNCATNQYASGDECKTCPSGATCDGTANFTCRSNKIKTSSGCANCPTNATCNGTEKFTCPDGKYADGSNCKKCAAGTAGTGGTCSACTGATIANGTGKTSCSSCSGSNPCPNTSHSSCVSKKNSSRDKTVSGCS